MATTDATHDTRTATEGASADRGFLAVTAMCLGFFVIQLDATIINVALPDIGRTIGGATATLQWIVAAYTIALAALMLTSGGLADRFGAKRLFIVGISVFGVASALCGIANGAPMLIAARAVQGMGAAMLLPCSLALIVHQFPDPRARAKTLGIWGAFGSLGMAAGPLLGGLLIAIADWRAVFLVNIPVAVATIWMVSHNIPEAPRSTHDRTDIPGVVFGTTALGLVAAAFIEAGQRGWTSSLAVVLFLLAVIAGTAFIVSERRSSAPILPMEVFRSRQFSAVTCVGFCFNMCLYGALLCVSLYLQDDLHFNAFKTGLIILPMTVSVAIGSYVSGHLAGKLGPRIPMCAGMAIAAVGAALLAIFGSNGSVAPIVAGSMILGLCSVAMPAMTGLAVSSAKSIKAGLASGIFNTARQSGGAVGVAVLGSLLGGSTPLRVPLTVVSAGLSIGLVCAVVATQSPSRYANNSTP